MSLSTSEPHLKSPCVVNVWSQGVTERHRWDGHTNRHRTNLKRNPSAPLKHRIACLCLWGIQGGLSSEIILPLFCREEAKKIWEKREEEWEREKVARDRLMSEVMTSIDDVSPLAH